MIPSTRTAVVALAAALSWAGTCVREAKTLFAWMTTAIGRIGMLHSTPRGCVVRYPGQRRWGGRIEGVRVCVVVVFRGLVASGAASACISSHRMVVWALQTPPVP